MQPGTAGGRPGSEAGLAGQAAVSAVDPVVVQPGSGDGGEQVPAGQPGPQLAAVIQVLAQRGRGGRVEREQAGFAELAAPDRQDAGVLVEVADLERERLADPHARRCQGSDQSRVGKRADRTGQPGGGGHQGGDLGAGIQVGGRAVRPGGDEPGGRDLGGGVQAVQPGGERADGRQPQRMPPGRAAGCCRPGQGVLGGHRDGLVLFEVAEELAEQLLGAVQPEPQRPADAQVVSQCLAQRGHGRPCDPGQARATVRRAPMSTLAYIAVVSVARCRSSWPISSSGAPAPSIAVAAL